MGKPHGSVVPWIVGAVAILLAASLGAQAGPVLELKLGHVVPETHAYHLGAIAFAKLIEQRTDGRVRITVYPAGQLATGERALLEQVQLGAADLAVTATGVLSGFVPEFAVVDLPFLFRDYAHASKVLDGPVGDQLLAMLERAGLKGLAFWENGFRHFTNSVRPINRPEDLRGLKIRTMENPIHIDAVRQLGALPTPMAWPIYTELQTKVLDGQENPIAIIYVSKFWEVQKYVALTGHFYSAAPLTMNLRRFNSLPPDVQHTFVQTARQVALYERSLIRNQERQQLEELKQRGMIVTVPDRAAFRRAMQPVYEKYFQRFPIWREIVRKIGQDP
jgi:tripartite ATP-independent transporter DctP family solute receptor